MRPYSNSARMEDQSETSAVTAPSARPASFSNKLPTVVLEVAGDAFINAILVLVLGKIAISLVGGIWGDMVPSAPPGFHHQFEAEDSATPVHNWFSLSRNQLFLLIFFLIFCLKLWLRLSSRAPGNRKSALRKAAGHVYDNWFDLIVFNAFGAMISAMLVVWVQRFSPAQFIIGAVLGAFATALKHFTDAMFGAHRADALISLFSWYGANQLKFTFWLLYLAAICDDLGVPNLKTIARAWRRRLSRKWRQWSSPRPLKE
jgi:hypothetical protein